jgi:sec-independent protein translocase protein TatC
MCAIGLSMPFWMTQGYLFVAPGLYKHEKWAVSLFFVAFTLLFAAGVAVLYYAILPNAIHFLLHYQQNSQMQITFYAKISEYVSTILTMAIGFGFAFQLPLVLIALNLFGIITYNHLQKFRRYAVVLIFIAAAILTPPDVVSQIILATIMICFYEITILICKIVQKQQPIQDDLFGNIDE